MTRNCWGYFKIVLTCNRKRKKWLLNAVNVLKQKRKNFEMNKLMQRVSEGCAKNNSLKNIAFLHFSVFYCSFLTSKEAAL